jgi:hypothetical protein
MGYTRGKDVMEICNVVGSVEGHNAYNCVFALLEDMNKRFP